MKLNALGTGYDVFLRQTRGILQWVRTSLSIGRQGGSSINTLVSMRYLVS